MSPPPRVPADVRVETNRPPTLRLHSRPAPPRPSSRRTVMLASSAHGARLETSPRAHAPKGHPRAPQTHTHGARPPPRSQTVIGVCTAFERLEASSRVTQSTLPRARARSVNAPRRRPAARAGSPPPTRNGPGTTLFSFSRARAQGSRETGSRSESAAAFSRRWSRAARGQEEGQRRAACRPPSRTPGRRAQRLAARNSRTIFAARKAPASRLSERARKPYRQSPREAPNARARLPRRPQDGAARRLRLASTTRAGSRSRAARTEARARP